MNEFYILLPTRKLPSVADWQQKLQEIEPGFSLDTKFDPAQGGVWECTYTDEETQETYCCDFYLEDAAPLFEKAPELAEYTNNCEAVATFYAEEEDESNLAAAYALAESLLSLVPGGYLFDPYEGQLMHGEDAVVFFHEELMIEEFEEEE